MMEKLKIDIVSDVVCPWCVIGFKNLQKAINQMEDRVEFEVEWNLDLFLHELSKRLGFQTIQFSVTPGRALYYLEATHLTYKNKGMSNDIIIMGS